MKIWCRTSIGRLSLTALSSLLLVSCGSIKASFKKLTPASTQSIFLSFEDTTLSLHEGSAALVYLTVSEKRSVPTVVRVKLTSPRGDAAIDFQSVPTTVTIPANTYAVPIALNVNSDSLYEGSEDFQLEVEAVENKIVAGPATLNLTVNDTPPAVTFLMTNQSTPESGGPVTVTVAQDIRSNFSTIIPYTIAGTATGSGTDYTLSAGTLTIPSGSTSYTFTFPVVNDSVHEDTETAILNLGTPTHATLGTLSSHTININDDDPVPTVNFSVATQTVNENVGTVIVTAMLSNPNNVPTLVPFTVSGTSTAADHNAVAGTITIPPGAISANSTFNVTDDSLHEGNETVIFSMGTVVNATVGTTNVQTVTINDNEGVPTVNFAAASQTVSESVGTVTVGVTMSGPSVSNVVVPFTVSGTAGVSDHDLVNGSITITAGQTTGSTTFNVTDDSTFELTETAILTMGTPTGAAVGATTTHTVSITDNDTGPSLSIADASVSEGTGASTTNLVFTVTLSSITGSATTVDYATSPNTATGGGTDYDDTSGTLTIAAGATTGTITVPVKQDSLNENNETFWVNLSNPTNASISDNQGVGTITDDDNPPSVSFTAAAQSVSENVGSVTVTAELSTASGLAVTVPFTVSGTATGSGTDHNAAAGTITIAAGSTTGAYTFNVADDSIAEGDETVILTIGTPTNATVGGTSAQTVTINDNEGTPTVDFSAVSQSVAESVGAVTISASLDIVSGSAVTVPFTVSGTASGAGADHDLAAGTITISAGQSTGSTTFNVIDDSLHEQTETVILTMGSPTGANAGTTTTHTVSITDNDAAPSLTISDVTVTEGTGASTTDATFTVTLSAASGLATTVDYTTTANTATGGGTDYNDTSGTLTIAAGATTGTITVPVKQDSLNESSETFYVDLSNPTQSTITDGRGIGTITDDDAAPAVNFTAATQSVNENAGTATVTAQLASASGLAVTVPFTISGTATGSGADHDAANGTITITAGATTGSYTFNIVDDAIYESTETVILTMGTPTNATAGTTNVHTVSITDNEATPTVDFSLSSQTAAENAGSVTVGVTMSAASGSNVIIPFALSGTASGSDHDLVAGNITITAGQTTGSKTFNVTDDSLHELTETVILTMGTPIGADVGTTTVHTVSITDNDTAPTLSVGDVTVTEGTGAGTTDAVFTVTLSAASGTVTNVDYATAPSTATGGGTDYTNTSGTLTIAAGATAGAFTVPVIHDSLDEANETFEVNLSNPVNATIADAQGTGTITDDDAEPTVQFTAATQAVGEGAGTVTVTVQLSAASGLPVTVPFTVSGTAAGGGTDHDAVDGNISIVAGSTSATYTFNLVDDALSEANETVIFTIGSPTNASVGATGVHTVTINDNEGVPTVNFSVASQNVTEAVGTVTVGVSMNMASASNVFVPFTVSGTSGAADHDLVAGNITIAAGQTSGSTTFNVTDDSLHESTETAILTMGALTGASAGATNVHTVNISDNDSAPSITISDATVTEGTGGGTTSATFTITLSASSGVDVTVDYATSANTATGGGIDYNDTSGTLTIVAGSTTGTVTVPVIQDALDENNESFAMNLSNPTAATLSDSQGIGSITDDDNAPTLNFAAATQSVSEGVGTVTVTAELSAASGLAVTAPFTISGTATASGIDHDAANGTLTIAAGSTSTTYTFDVIDDSISESNETVIFTMGTPTNATAGSTTVHTVTINDNEAAPTVTFAAASQTVAESVGTVTVGVTVSPVSASAITVPFTVSGTTNGSDHDLVAGTITIAASQSTGSTTFSVTDDSLYELTETAILTMGTPSGATTGATTVHTVSITDNDTAPSISIGDAAVTEGTGGTTTNATFTVTLSAASGAPTSVDYQTTANTATGGGTDYNNASGSLTIAAGSTSATITVAVKHDAIDENDETYWVDISNAVNGTIADAQGVGTINDDDDPPIVNFTASTQSISESGGSATITAQLSSVSGLAATIPFTVTGSATGSGTDHNAANGTITIAAGSTTGTYSFNIVDDTIAESDETVILTMGSPTNATAGTTTVHTVTITDNEATPAVTFAAVSQSVTEAVGNVTVGVTVSPVSASAIIVPFTVSGTTNGSDHDLVAGTITISAGQSSGSIAFTVTDDSLYEPTETAILTMGTPSGATTGATTVHTVSITDNDTAPSITISDTTVTEGTGAGTTDATLTVTLSALSGVDAKVDFTTAPNTATGGGTDYDNTSGTLTIAAGSTTGTITVPVQQDSMDENNETFYVNLSNPVGATVSDSQGVITINDDDNAPTVNFATASQSAGEGAGTVTVTAEISSVSGLAITVPFTISGTATAGGTDHDAADGTITVAAGATSGAYTFTVTDDAIAESNETVIFTMGTPTNATAGSTTVHTVTINDNEATPVANFTAASQTVAESVGTVTVSVSLSPVSASAITVPFTVSGTTNGSDHDLVAGTITVAANQSSASTTFSVIDDTLYEASETAILTMGTPTGANAGTTTVHTVTITDNDTAPSLSISDATVTEGTGGTTTDATFTVTLSASSGVVTKVDYATTPNTATGGGTDYNNTSGTLTIAAGSTSGTITVPVKHDALDEANETFYVDLTNPVNATISDAQGIGTINDDDNAPTVNFTAASQSVGEAVGTVTVTAELSAVSGLDVTVPFTVSGTATGSGTDHNAANGSITINAGSTTGTYTFTVTDDTASESDETVILTMGSPTNATAGATNVHTVTIQDDEGSRTINFSAASQTVAENVGTVTVQATISSTSASNVTLPFTVTGTTSGSDHDLAAGTITVAAGQTTGSITFSVTNDTLYEATETVILTMGTPTGAVVGSTNVHTVSITDNDTAPSLSISDATVTEGTGGTTTDATFTVTLSASSGVATKVDYATAPNTATGGGTDYNNASGTLTIAAGSTTGTITVQVVHDGLDEANETFYVNLTNPIDATITDAQGIGTINDDDNPPTVNFTTASQSVNENVGSVTVTAQLSAVSGLAATIPFTLSGSATGSGTDHDAASGAITIPAGSTSANYTFNVTDDSVYETSETVIFTMGSPTNATAGTTTVHTVTITDNEAAPTVTFTAASQTVGEAVGAVTVSVSASSSSSSAITIPFTVTGTASGSDHDLSNGTITISAGQTTGSAVFNITNDSLYEATETVILTMGSPTGATTGATTVHTVFITDNDSANAPVISITDTAVTEGTGGSTTDAVFTINLNATSGIATKVDYTTTPNTATGGGVDYNNASGTLTIAAGATSGTITIAVKQDALDEANETFYIDLSNPVDATISDAQGIGTINDDDNPPTVNFTAASQTVGEGSGTVTVTAQLSTASGLEVTVPFTVSGTATGSGTDHNAANGTITIAAGATTGDYTFTITDDSLAESSETVIFTIGSPTNATTGSTNVHTVTINDNEATPTVTFASSGQTVSEGVGSVTVGVTTSGASSSNITVPFIVSGTASGSDHDLVSGTITVTAGQTSGSTTFNITNDSLYELTETVILTMGTPTNATAGATTVHTVSITDNDTAPSISISDGTVTEGTGAGTTNATFTVSLNTASGASTTVDYATAANTATGGGVDYNNASGTLTIAAGATTGTITVQVIQDALDEANETFYVNLSNPVNATISDNQGVGTINDDDNPPTVNFTAASQTVNENVGTVTVTAQLSAVSGLQVTVPFTVSGTATGSGTDHNAANGTITIAAGSTSSDYTFTITDDSIYESTETVILTMGSPTNATAGSTTVHTASITDNESAPTVNFAAASQTVGENVGTVTVGVTLSGTSSSNATIPFTVSGTASGSDHDLVAGTITVTAGQTTGSQTFNITNDSLYEATETVILTMGSPTGATAGSTTVHTVSITDNDTAPSITISDVTVTEGTGGGTTSATFTVSLSAASGVATTVAYATSANTATGGGTDYNNTSGTLTIAAGSTTGTITVPVIQDSLDENDETFWVDLSSPTNATISDNQGVGTITDDDAQPTISVANVTVSEGGTNATFTATLSAVSGRDVTFSWATSNGTATAGSDYTASSGSGLTITAGSTTKTFTVPITDDSTNCEGSETFTITLSSVTNATASPSTALGTITENDSTSLSVSDVTLIGGETATFTISASPTCPQAITFDWSTSDGTGTAGTHYTTSSGTSKTIAANASSTTVTVPTLDTVITSAKTFNVTISNASSNATIGDGTGVATLAAPALNLDLVNSLPASMTFTRASNGTYYDSDRVLRTAGIDVPRFDYDAKTGKPRGLLLEESRTNWLPGSHDYALWTGDATHLKLTLNQLAPDGSYNAAIMEDISATQRLNFRYFPTSALTAGTYTLSVFVKKATSSVSFLPLFRARTTASVYQGVYLDPYTGTTTASGSIVSKGVFDLGDWWRVYVTFTSAAAVDRVEILPAESPNSAALGAVTVYGVQIEDGTYPTSYIATGTKAVTRAADNAGVLSTSWYSSTGGVLTTDLRVQGYDSNGYLSHFTNSSTGSQDSIGFQVLNSGSNWTLAENVTNGGAAQSEIYNSSAISLNSDQRLGLRFKSNDLEYVVNGASKGTDTTVNLPTNINQLAFGKDTYGGSTSTEASIALRSVKYFTESLNSASLVYLTQADSRPTLYIDDATATEGGNLTFTIRLSSAISGSATAVNWTATNGTATVGTDTSGSSSGTATIAANTTSTTVTIATANDSTVESAETISVTLSGLPTTVVAGDIVGTGTIQDATLNYDFTSYPTSGGVSLPSNLTFSRTSVGRYYDSTGTLKTSAMNAALWSEQFSTTTSWTATRALVVPNTSATTAPDGSYAADHLIEDTTASNSHYVAQTGMAATASTIYTFSVYAKTAGRSVRLQLFDSAGTGGCIAPFDLSNGTVAAAASLSGSGASGPSSAIISAGNGWYRLSITCQLGASATASEGSIYTIAHGTTTAVYTGDGLSGAYIWGAQMEQGSSATPYFRTTSAASYAPRFDYDPATCANGTAASGNPGCTRKALGLLMESGMWNEFSYSQTFSNAAWTKGNLSVTSSATTAPDGTTTADFVKETTTSNAVHYLDRTISSKSVNVDWTFSAYVKSNGRSFIMLTLYQQSTGNFFRARFDLSTGTVADYEDQGNAAYRNATITALPNGWYRITVTGTPNPSGTTANLVPSITYLTSLYGDTYTGVATNGFYVWGAQLEQSSIPSSYIATTTGTVYRNLDTVRVNNLASWYTSTGAWTTFIDLSRLNYESTAFNNYPFVFEAYLSTNRDQNRISAYYETNPGYYGMDAYSNTSTALGGTTVTVAPVARQTHKLGYSYGSTIQIVKDGTLGTAGSISTATPVDSFSIGGDGGSWGAIDGHLRKFQFVPRTLTTTQMQTITQ